MYKGDQYTPNSEKRWKVSEDEISRERLKGIREMHDYFKEQIPGVTVAVSLFGSLSKGKELDQSTAQSADMDLSVFVDYEEFEKNFQQIFLEHPESDFVKFVKEQAEDVKGFVLDPFSFSTPSSKDFLNYALWCFIEKSFADRFGNLSEQNTKKTAYVEIRKIGLSGPDSILSKATNSYNNKAQSADVADNGLWSIEIARYFHLDIGGDMKKYRKDFYKEMADSLAVGGNKAEFAKKLWKHIVMAMKTAERYTENLPPELAEKFPSDNLEEFLEKQNIPIPGNQDHA